MVPFTENNDGCRLMMNGSQAKQMLPLKNPQAPIIMSGYESLFPGLLSSNFVKKSEISGKVIEIKYPSIIIRDLKNKTHYIDISSVHLKSGSGRDTLSVFKPTVQVGDLVKKNEIIAEGSCVHDKTIALGRTLCVAYMAYEGYNFEDAIIINENVIKDEKLVSIHGIIQDVILSKDDRVLQLAEIDSHGQKGSTLLRKTIGELSQLVDYEDNDETEISMGQEITKSPGGKLVEIEVFSNLDDMSDFPLLKELSIKTDKKYKKKDTKYKIKSMPIKDIMVRFKIEQELVTGIGDKLCGRYGNKGIISLIEKDENMPISPIGDKIDIILNPIGIINRMNIGQLYELYAGLISRELGNRIVTQTWGDKNATIKLLLGTLPLLIKDEFKSDIIDSVNNLNKLSKKEFDSFQEKIEATGFMPIVVPPFKSPSHENIKKCLDILGLKTGYNLFLPKYGVSTSNKVPVGFCYISKLEHIGEAKIAVRSTGPILSKTGSPTAGAKRGGGQRIGELDSYSFFSYNALTTLSELMGPLSNDQITKNELISDIIETGEAKFRVAKSSPTRDLLNVYFSAMMLEKR